MWRHVECSKIKLNFEALIGFGVFFLSTNIFFRILKYPGSQGSLAEGEESVQLTSSLRKLFRKKVNNIFNIKIADMK